jgi:hypothetical protein
MRAKFALALHSGSKPAAAVPSLWIPQADDASDALPTALLLPSSPSWWNVRQLVCRCSLYVIALVTVELSARTCKSERVQTSDEIRALAKSWCRQVRHGAWRSGED